MVNPVTPVPEAALTTQLVNGVVSVLVDQGVLSKLFPGLLGGLKLF